jgi:hypothetical protein
MAIIPKVESEKSKMLLLKNFEVGPSRKSEMKNIFCSIQNVVTTDPIESKRVSNKCLNTSSMIKAGLLFFSMIAGGYLFKTGKIFSYFRRGGKNSKDLNGSEIAKKKNVENVMTLRRDLKTKVKTNNPFVDHTSQAYYDKDRTVKFEAREVEDIKDFDSDLKKENVKTRRSINIQNPIPDQKTVVKDYFKLIIDGNNVFNSDSPLFLEVINIPDWLWLTPLNLNPTFKNSYNTSSRASEVTVSGNYAYIGNENSGIQIVDISDLSNPIFKSSYCYNWYDSCAASEIIVSGNYAYVADLYSGLQIIDISNSSNPVLKGSYEPPGVVEGIALSGDYAYLVSWDSGLVVVDIANVTNPTFKGSCNTLSYASGVAVFGNYAYAVDNYGLQILDVSNPSNPTLKGLYYTPDRTTGIAVSGDYAYVANGFSGLQIVNISDPLNPTFKGSHNTYSLTYEVALSGNYAYMADGVCGLHIVEITHPSHPTTLQPQGFCNTSDYAWSVFVSGNYAYVANGELGLQIVSINVDNLTLSGNVRGPKGKYSVGIKACNEAGECVTDTFDIIVEDFSNQDSLVAEIVGSIVGSIAGSVCIITIIFCASLIIGRSIVVSKKHRHKTLKDEKNIEEQKSEIFELSEENTNLKNQNMELI